MLPPTRGGADDGRGKSSTNDAKTKIMVAHNPATAESNGRPTESRRVAAAIALLRSLELA